MTTDLVATMQQAATPAAAEDAPRRQGIVELIDAQRSQFGRALGAAGMDPDRFARSLLTECRRTPKLLECDPYSVLGAAMTCAQLALEPGPLGHAYLIPRWNRDRRVMECTFQLGYRGMIDLALRSGRTRSIDAHVVYPADEFEFAYGTEPFLRHRPTLEHDSAAEPVAVYAVALLAEGGAPFVVLSIAEVERRRARSSAPDSPAWRSDWAAMARKTAVRALSPYIPQTAEFALANRLDEQVRTDFSSTLDELDVAEPPASLAVRDPAHTDGDGVPGEGEPVDPGFDDGGAAIDLVTAEDPGSPDDVPVDLADAVKPVTDWSVTALRDACDLKNLEVDRRSRQAMIDALRAAGVE
jgi:recombination protein RecT